MGLLVFLTGCPIPAQKAEPMGKAYFTYFDTVSYVYSYAGDSQTRFEENSDMVAGVLEEYHRLFDIYHAYSGVNNLYTVNELAGGEMVQVDEKLVDFLLYCKELYETTDGKMNILLGSVLRLWHDCRTAAADDPKNAAIPSPEALAEAARHTDISLLEIDVENSAVRLTDPHASIDVGAVGKGYATEMAARMLEERGCESYVLNIGGNIRIVGQKPDGSGWNTGIKDPKAPDSAYAAFVTLADTACVTSGVYERYFTVDGEKYHHIIDPETLYPATRFSAITVVTKDSGLADVLSTALFCMDYEAGRQLVESLQGVDVLWITPDGEILMTSGMEARITQ